jgi:hypothetical protein
VTKTLSFNRDNWTGETGSLTYSPDKPLHFKVDSMPECEFWLEAHPWDTTGLDQETVDLLDLVKLGERFRLYGSDWATDFPLAHLTKETTRVEGNSLNLWRESNAGVKLQSATRQTPTPDFPEETFSIDERLLVVAARLIFNTV